MPALIAAQTRTLLQRRAPHYKRWLQRLVELPSYTRDPSDVRRQAQVTTEMFSEQLRYPLSALTVESDAAHHGPHLVLRSGGLSSGLANRPVVGMVSHLDTVYPREQLQRDHFAWQDDSASTDRLLGPGTMDIKVRTAATTAILLSASRARHDCWRLSARQGGTVLICMILDALQTLAPETYHALDFAVLLNAAEEEMATDFARVADEQLDSPAGCLANLVFESGKVCTTRKEATVVVARKGRCVWKMQAAGIEGHAGNAHQTSRNAIVELARAVTAASELTDSSKEVTVNVGTFHGGIGVNTVPGSAQALVEMRAADKEVFERTAQMMDDLMAGAHHPHVLAERELTVPPWTANTRTEGLVEVYAAAAAEVGYSVQTQARGGGSDGNWLWEKWPTIDGLGPSGANAHCSALLPPPEGDLACAVETETETREYAEWSSFVTKATIGVVMIAQLLDRQVASG